MKPIVLSFCALFSTVTLHQTKTFLHILDNDSMKTFGSGQSSILNKHKTKTCAELMFASLSAPLKIAVSQPFPYINYGRSNNFVTGF